MYCYNKENLILLNLKSNIVFYTVLLLLLINSNNCSNSNNSNNSSLTPNQTLFQIM